MEYVKDKWYEINNSWYARYNKTIYNNWYYLESITTNGKYQRNHNGANIDVKNDIKLLESLQEIQKWLPDDHPQKITPVIQETKEQQLLEEAKRRYPPDTLFKLAHLNGVTGVIRSEYNFKYEKGHDNRDYLYVTNNNIVVNDKDGMSYCVYYKGKWAEIVEDKWIPKVGDKVYDRINKVHRTVIDISYLPKSVTLSEQGETYVNQLDYICHEIPNQSLVGRYVKCTNLVSYLAKPGDYLKILTENNNSYQLEKYGIAAKPLNPDYFVLMPEGFVPIDDYSRFYDQALIKEMQKFGSKDYTVGIDPIMDYGTKGEMDISVKDFYDKYWIVKGVKSKSKLIEVIPLQQVKELRQTKKSKLITI